MIALSIGGIDIYRYGIMYFISFITGYAYLRRLSKQTIRDPFPTTKKILQEHTEDILITIVSGVIIGGRLGHIMIYDLGYFIQHPLKIFAINEGGMSFIGGLIGVIVGIGIWIIYNKRSYQDMLRIGDSILSFTPIGIFLGRIGNFLNQELYGITIPADFRGLPNKIVTLAQNSRLFYIYDTVDQLWRINTNMLSALGEGLLLFIIVQWQTQKMIQQQKRQTGKITGLFLTLYSTIRFLLEYLRFDSSQEFIGLFTKSQYFFIVFFVRGMYIRYTSYKKTH